VWVTCLSFTDRVAGQDMVSGGWSAQVKTHPVTSEGEKKGNIKGTSTSCGEA
jgi:hypothetical protein